MHLVTDTVRRAVRRLFRSPLFFGVAVLTLGVGIGANSAIFSVVYGVLLKPLPFDEPERLVGVWHTAPGLNFDLMNQGPATYLTYREEGRVFEDIGLWDNTAVSVTGVSEPERLDGLLVTDRTLPLLRVRPAIGRLFTKEDDTAERPETVMLTYGYWQRKFGGDPGVLGKPLIVEGRPREIIGVLPQEFRFLQYNPSVVMTFQFNRAEVFVGNFSYQGVARLKPGVTLEQANADIARMIPLVPEKFPLPPGFERKAYDEIRMGPRVRALSEDVIGDIGRLLWVLLGTVGIVLLIACANVANLFLVRAEGRQQEMAIRSALGGSWSRLAREVLGESVLLGIAGGIVGVGFAYAGIRLLVALEPEGLPRLGEIGLDPAVLLFTLVISLVAGLLFGLLPVFKLASPRLAASLKEGGRGSSDGRERHRVRHALVVAEVALAVVLLVGSGLMIRTFQAMRNVDPGFTNPEEVMTLRLSIPAALVEDPEQVLRTHEQIAQKIGQIPGVTSVGLSSSITMDGYDSNDPIFVEEFPGAPGRLPPLRRFKWVSGNYFETMGRRLVAGRTLTWADSYNRAKVVMVSENFAREFWPANPALAIGKRIRQSPGNPWREIVGVVADERDDGFMRPAPSLVYWPMLMDQHWTTPVFVRRVIGYAIRGGRVGSPTFMKELQQAVWSVNGNLPLAEVRSLDEIRAESMAQTSFMLVMLAIAASVALLLGVVGIYGVIAYIAAQRTREIGIRIALGAQQSQVSRHFVTHGLVLAGIGIVIGVGAAAGLTRLMAALLFGVSATDPLTYVTVSLGLALVAALASYLPARRASRVDPVIALRAEG